MDEMRRTDKLFLVFHRAGWSTGVTAFEGMEFLPSLSILDQSLSLLLDIALHKAM